MNRVGATTGGGGGPGGGGGDPRGVAAGGGVSGCWLSPRGGRAGNLGGLIEPGLDRRQWSSGKPPWNQASASWGGPGASWAQHGWIDFDGGVAAPPQVPPGIADPLANPLLDPWSRWAQIGEKHADEAEWAARGWIDRSKTTQMREPWCEPTQRRGDWQQCTPAQPDSRPRNVWGAPLPDLDKKDIERPERYSGDITGWLKWKQSFIRFLRRKDPRWAGLLEKGRNCAASL